MFYDFFIAPFADFEFMRRALAGTLALALRSIADLNAVETRSDDQPKRGDSINVVRFGVSSPTTTQK